LLLGLAGIFACLEFLTRGCDADLGVFSCVHSLTVYYIHSYGGDP